MLTVVNRRVILLALPLVLAALAGARAEQWEYYMDGDPRLTPLSGGQVFPSGVIEIWQQAAKRQDDELRRLLGESIVRAEPMGLQGLEKLLPDLEVAFRQSASPAAKLNLAAALIVLEDREMAEELAAAADRSVELSAVIEPAMARWGVASRSPVWRARAVDRGQSIRGRLIAIRAAGQVGDAEAGPVLVQLALAADEPMPIRLEAAAAASHCLESDPVEEADQLLQDDSQLSWLLAARLLRQARQDQSLPLLRRLAVHPNASVAPLACERLAEQWPMELVALAPETAAHPSPRVRLTTIGTIAEHASQQAVPLLGSLLPDPHPEVRFEAAAELIKLAEQQRPAVLEQVDAVVAGPQWQGHAQAMRVAEALKYEGAIPAAFDLLQRPTIESRNAAAFFLGRVALPEDASQLWQHLTQLLELRQSGIQWALADEEVMQLLQGVGRLRYEPADEKLREVLSKGSPYPIAIRSAAAWALGKIHEDMYDQPLAQLMIERYKDIENPIGSEADEVRMMCAIGLGRMKAKPQLDELMAQGMSNTSKMGLSTAWAYEQITGEDADLPPPRATVIESGFFLFPPPRLK